MTADWLETCPCLAFVPPVAAFRFVVRNEHFHFFVVMLIVCLGLLILLLALKLSNQVRNRSQQATGLPLASMSRSAQEYFVWILGLTVVSAHVRPLPQTAQHATYNSPDSGLGAPPSSRHQAERSACVPASRPSMHFWRKYVPWPRGIRFGVYAYRNTLVYTIDGLEKVYTFKVRPNRLTHASDLLHRHAMPAV